MRTVDLFTALAQVSALLFVVSSMLGMGLSLTVPDVTDALGNWRTMLLALVASFVLVPAIAVGLAAALNLDEPVRVGLVLLGACAGAPFLPKLVEAGGGDSTFGVGLMTVLMVLTVGYAPLVLPRLLPGVAVDAAAIATSLIGLMLVPLAVGMLLRAARPEDAQRWGPLLGRVSSMALLVLVVVGLGLSLPALLSLIGSRGILAVLLLLVAALAVGLLLGGRDPQRRTVVGLGTAQRTISAAILIASQNFGGTATPSFVIAGGILGLLLLLPAALALGRRTTGEQPPRPRTQQRAPVEGP